MHGGPRLYRVTVEERFTYVGWSLEDGEDGCWLWLGRPNNAGYGSLSGVDRQGKVGAHVYAWERAYGPVPPGREVCHTCDTPLCLRLDHLWLGTHADNMLDMHAKGRWSATYDMWGEQGKCSR